MLGAPSYGPMGGPESMGSIISSPDMSLVMIDLVVTVIPSLGFISIISECWSVDCKKMSMWTYHMWRCVRGEKKARMECRGLIDVRLDVKRIFESEKSKS